MPADTDLHKLRTLQHSTVQSLINLRVIKAENSRGNVPLAKLDPLQTIVNDQAATISTLQTQLRAAEAQVNDVMPRQESYLSELERQYVELEGELGEKAEDVERRDKDFKDVVKLMERERLRNEVLVGKHAMAMNDVSRIREERFNVCTRLIDRIRLAADRVILRTAFDGLTQEMGTGRKMRKFCLRWRNMNVFKTFTSWVAYVAANKQEKVILSRFRTRMLNSCLTRCYSNWTIFVGERRSLRKLARRVFGRCLHGKLFECWGRWRTLLDADALLVLRGKAVKVIQRIVNKHLNLAWRLWKEYVQLLVRNEAVVRKFAIRFRLRAAVMCVGRWREYVRTRVGVRRLINRLVGGRDGLVLGESWKVWTKYCSQRGVKMMIKREEDMLKKIEELTAQVTMLTRNTEDLQIKTAGKMIALWKNKTLLNFLHAWKQFTEMEQSERVRMERFIRKWRNMTVFKCFCCWGETMKERKRNQGIVGKFLKRMNVLGVVRCLDGWKCYVDAGKRERFIVGKFRARLLNAGLRMAYGSWREFVATRKWLRSLVLRGLKGKIAAGFGTWVRQAKGIKEEAEEGARRDCIMRKFFVQMQMRTVVKCFRQWGEGVEQRKWLRKLMNRCLGGSYFAMINDAFRMWGDFVDDAVKGELTGTLEELKATVKSQSARIGVLETEMVKYTQLKMDFVCHKVVSRLIELWTGLVRDAFVNWKNRLASLNKYECDMQKIKRSMLRRLRFMEHNAFQRWHLFARERTGKLKGTMSNIWHTMIKMRNYHLNIGFRKWVGAARKAEGIEVERKAERRLVVSKASQALMMLERSVKDGRREIEEEGEAW